jgi:hypothetical protein
MQKNVHFTEFYSIDPNVFFLLFSQATHITFICPMLFDSFPLDIQVCKFQVCFKYRVYQLYGLTMKKLASLSLSRLGSPIN